MDEITDEKGALHQIARRGYLNEISTPADSWFEAGDTRLASDEYGYLINSAVAEKLIKTGKVVEVERGNHAVCYRLA